VLLSGCESDQDSEDRRTTKGYEPKNLLFIVLDAAAAKHSQIYGYPRETTPFLADLAESGHLFMKARSQAGSTLPSTTSFLTGAYPPFVPHPGIFEWVTDQDSTLAETFRSAGFTTGAFSENAWVSRASGFDRGFDQFEQFRSINGEEDRSNQRNPSTQLMDAAVHWISSTGRERSWFCYVHILRPHTPYATPPDFSDAFKHVDVKSLIGGEKFTNRDMSKMGGAKEASRTYDANLRYADFLVSQLVARLTEMGRMDDTVVLVTSDHGESFWEHGRYGHAHFLHEHLVHVPLVIRVPEAMGIEPRVVDDLVELVDLFPTLVELFGISPPDGLEGDSLVPMMRGEPASVTASGFAQDGWLERVAVFDQQRKAIFEADHDTMGLQLEGYFDLQKDPAEQVDLGELADGLEPLRHLAESYFSTQARNSLSGQEGDALPQEQIDELKAIGYLE